MTKIGKLAALLKATVVSLPVGGLYCRLYEWLWGVSGPHGPKPWF